MTFSYLEFLDNPTPENVQIVHSACGLIQPEAAKVAGIGLQTYRGWHSSVDSKNYRRPHNTSWNLFLYELEARRLGYSSLFELVNSR